MTENEPKIQQEEKPAVAKSDNPASQPKKKRRTALIAICIAAVLAVCAVIMEEQGIIDMLPEKTLSITLEYPQEGTMNDSLLAAYQETEADSSGSYAVAGIIDPSTGEETDAYKIDTSYEVTLTRTSSIGYRSERKMNVIFIDTQAPAISAEEGSRIIIGESVIKGVTAEDNYDAACSLTIDGVDINTAGLYNATITAADSSGNTATSESVIRVSDHDTKDDTYAAFTLAGNPTVNLIADTEPPYLLENDAIRDGINFYMESTLDLDVDINNDDVVFYDDYDEEEITDGSFESAGGTIYVNVPGTYPIKLIISDKAGNTVETDANIIITGEKIAYSESGSSSSSSSTDSSGFDTSNPFVAEALSLVGRTDLLCDDVVALCLQAAGKDYWWGSYTEVSDLQIGDVIMFYSTQDFGLGAEHNSTYGYHIIGYIGNGKCINGNYAGSTQITSCSSAKAEWQVIRRY